MLDLCEGRWEGKLLHPGDCMLSADAKPSIQAQARARMHPTASPTPGAGSASSTSEYQGMGALTYLDAWGVRRGRVMGRSEPKGSTTAFDRLAGHDQGALPIRAARVLDRRQRLDHRG